MIGFKIAVVIFVIVIAILIGFLVWEMLVENLRHRKDIFTKSLMDDLCDAFEPSNEKHQTNRAWCSHDVNEWFQD